MLTKPAPAARPSRRRGRAIAHAAMPLMLCALLATTGSVDARAQAASGAVAAYDIPAGALAPALNRFAQQSGVSIAVDSARVQNLRTDGLRGSYGTDEGFRILLRGTGYAAARTAAGYVLVPAPASPLSGGAETLPPIAVTAAGAQTAWGPADGYVAARSATGTKTDTAILETPQSISVIPRQQLDDQAVHSVAQALRYSSGVFAEYRGSSNLHDETFIRGFGYAPRFLDGLMYGENSLGQVDPWMLERVEVIRGPSSVLYGQANPGGVISLVSKRPMEEASREVRLQVGNRGRLEDAFDVGGPVTADGSLLYRIVGLGNRFDLEERSVKQERVAIAPSLTWRPSGQTSITLLTNYQNEPNAGFRNFMPTVGTVYQGRNGHGWIPRDFLVSDPSFDESTREQFSAGYLLEHRFDGPFTFRQNTRYTHVDATYATLVFNYLDADERTLYRFASKDRQKVGQFVIDNQLEAKFTTGAVSHTALAGIDYRRTRKDYLLSRSFSVPSIDWTNPVYGVNVGALNPATDSDTTAWQVGAYVQDQIRWDRLTLTLGGRQDWANTKVDDRLYGADTDQSDHKFTGRVGATYQFDNGIAPYASYTTSFEPELSTPPVGSAAFKPVTGQGYEGGVKFAPPGLNALFTASVFDIRQQNVATYDRTIFGFVQSGEVHNRGFEFEGRGEVLPGLNLVASYSFVDSEVTKTTVAGAQGKTPARLPNHLASLWADYTIGRGPLAGLGLSAGTRYIGTSQGDAQNTYKVPAVTLFDLALKYDLGRIGGWLNGTQLQLNAMNVADTRYVASCAALDTCFYGSGRTLMATLSHKW